ncbi:predicted protein [Nematostella vectensis]|uniref:Uncharacterized protein n=1 Tax=Nematostella vectensis TaxID=45351 RepID=A7RM26_NEMVE|nr:predicted protein [Nematostella vectensis]|eukprot:XP_001639495.1 predicted protein [Nematostella vectensis]
MATFSLIFLAMFAASSGASLYENTNLPTCSEIRDDSCEDDAQCEQCVPDLLSDRKLICNWKWKCNKMSIIDIVSRQQCKNVFKKDCTTDDECQCGETQMVCENRECVKAKSHKVAARV